jgi:hypothetical protein
MPAPVGLEPHLAREPRPFFVPRFEHGDVLPRALAAGPERTSQIVEEIDEQECSERRGNLKRGFAQRISA